MQGETNLSVLIKNMQPILNDGLYVFSSVSSIALFNLDKILFFFKEEEGFTVVLEKKDADTEGVKYEALFAWITLHVHSALEAVGLTAAFATALGENNISCNVVAGYYHDHIFVQNELGEKAIAVLKKLAAEY